MKILAGRVDWMEDRANRPRLELLVDTVPMLDVMRFDERKGLYFAEHGGFCQFFSWRPERVGGNAGGFGGNTYNVTMRGGAIRMLTGPWSSSASTMNDEGFGPCMDVTLTDDPAGYARGYTFRAAAVLVSLLRDYVDVIDIGTGHSWRPGTAYAAEVAFPATSHFALACAGTTFRYTHSSRHERFWVVPEVLPDGVRVEDVRSAIFVAEAAGEHDFTQQSLAAPYVRYLGADAYDVLLALSSFEPAVQLPDGTFWVKPE